jgi:hypothetical protein
MLLPTEHLCQNISSFAGSMGFSLEYLCVDINPCINKAIEMFYYWTSYLGIVAVGSRPASALCFS